jgi:hypothetical protein
MPLINAIPEENAGTNAKHAALERKGLSQAQAANGLAEAAEQVGPPLT